MLLLLPLSSPFGDASATATSTEGGRLQLEVSVEVQGDFVAVVVRGVGPGLSELPPVALSDQGGGTWVGIVDLPIVDNILLGFEAIPKSGPATISELHTLTDLGVDRAVLESDHPVSAFGEQDNQPLVSTKGRKWGWLGLAAGAAALALIAFWAIESRRKGGSEAEEAATDETGDAAEESGDSGDDEQADAAESVDTVD
jgi:hypothetical protein